MLLFSDPAALLLHQDSADFPSQTTCQEKFLTGGNGCNDQRASQDAEKRALFPKIYKSRIVRSKPSDLKEGIFTYGLPLATLNLCTSRDDLEMQSSQTESRHEHYPRDTELFKLIRSKVRTQSIFMISTPVAKLHFSFSFEIRIRLP